MIKVLNIAFIFLILTIITSQKRYLVKVSDDLEVDDNDLLSVDDDLENYENYDSDEVENISLMTNTTGFRASRGGCAYHNYAPMFRQWELTYSPVRNWGWRIRNTQTVQNRIGWPSYRWMPDGHISTIKVSLKVFDIDIFYLFGSCRLQMVCGTLSIPTMRAIEVEEEVPCQRMHSLLTQTDQSLEAS